MILCFMSLALPRSIFLSGGDLAGVNVKRHAALFTQVTEQGRLLSAGGIAPEGQGAVISAAQDIGIRGELHGGWGDHVQKVLGHRRSFRLDFSSVVSF